MGYGGEGWTEATPACTVGSRDGSRCEGVTVGARDGDNVGVVAPPDDILGVLVGRAVCVPYGFSVGQIDAIVMTLVGTIEGSGEGARSGGFTVLHVGELLGPVNGCADGALEGQCDGCLDGYEVGCLVDRISGICEGNRDGVVEGFEEGWCDGCAEGPTAGWLVGHFVGWLVG